MKSDDCGNCASLSNSHFCNLKQKYLNFLNENKKHVTYRKGETIFREGDSPQGLYCIDNGIIRLNHIDEEGNEVILRFHKAGEMLGYRALFAEEKYHATAVAQENSEVCFIPKNIVKELMAKEPDLALSILKQVSKEIHSTEDRMTSIISKPVKSRVAEALIYFKNELPESKWTRKDIAEWIGTTPETVMRTLAHFESEGFIHQEGRLIRIADDQAISNISKEY
ncbi:MAG: Crp/Fnr family transcriptional regulator [Bdellovibrionota bacterium]